MKPPEMTSNKPYLLRAIYEWILDNQMIPHIVVDANAKNAKIPLRFAQDGKIILNISPHATQHLLIDNHYITFNARFSGTPMEVYAPMSAVLAIYARETGAGMVFEPAQENSEDDNHHNDGDNTPPPSSKPPKGGGKPKLTLVKS